MNAKTTVLLLAALVGPAAVAAPSKAPRPAPSAPASSGLTAYDEAARLLGSYEGAASGDRRDRLEGLLARAEELRAEDLLLRDEMERAFQRFSSLGMAATRDRADRWRTDHAAKAGKLLTLLDELEERRSGKKPLVDAATDALAREVGRMMRVPEADVREQILSASPLPGRGASAARREPEIRQGTPDGYDGGDFAGGGLPAPASEITAKAEELGRNPIDIYRFVRDSIRSESYAGEMKGAREALLQASGNDVDQGLLLAELLRASGFPARLVRGTVRVGNAALSSVTGASTTVAAQSILTEAGIPWSPVIEAGQTVAVDMEHVWVEALIPLANYRGSLGDELGKDWVPLAPAFKPVDVQAGIDVLALMGSSGEALAARHRQQWGSSAPPRLPQEIYRQEVEAWLAANRPGTSYDQAVRRTSLRPEPMEVLPAALPFQVLSMNEVFLQTPDALRHRVRFELLDHEGATSLDVTRPVAELLGSRLVLTYGGATPADEDTLRILGGVYRTPPALVDVVPVLRLQGAELARGSGRLVLGRRHTLRLHLTGPAGDELVENSLVAGNFHVLGLAGQGNSYQEEPGVPQDAAVLLFGRAADYLRRTRNAAAGAAEIAGAIVVSPTPDAVLVQNEIDVDFVFGQPMDLTWKSVSMDADLLSARFVSARGEAARSRDAADLAGWSFSALEARVFSEAWTLDTTSTVDFLGQATAMGRPIATVTAGNLEAFLAGAAFSDAVEADMRDLVLARGYTLLVTHDEMTLGAWTGVGYAARDPERGGGRFQLSGRLAGSVVFAMEWPAGLADPLRNPNNFPPNPDPGAAAKIERFESRNFQEATVDTTLPVNLAVYVSDAQGAPVMGAPVTWSCIQGGCETPGITRTNEYGVAEAVVKVGKRTMDSPALLHVNESDQYPTIVGVNLIDASVNTVRLDLPFLAYGLPDRPENIRFFRTPARAFAPALTLAGSFEYRVSDRLDNPTANARVTSRFKAAEPPGYSGPEELIDVSGCGQFLSQCNTAVSEAVRTAIPNGIVAYNYFAGSGEFTVEFETFLTETKLSAYVIATGQQLIPKLRPKQEAYALGTKSYLPFSVTYLDENGEIAPSAVASVAFDSDVVTGTEPGSMEPETVTEADAESWFSSYLNVPDQPGFVDVDAVARLRDGVTLSTPASNAVAAARTETPTPSGKVLVYRGRNVCDVSLLADMQPSQYVPNGFNTLLYQGGTIVGAFSPGPAGEDRLEDPVIEAGVPFDPRGTWQAQSIANLFSPFPPIESEYADLDVVPIDLAVTAVTPDPLLITGAPGAYTAAQDLVVTYVFQPAEEATGLSIVIYENGLPILEVPAASAQGTITIPAGWPVQKELTHQVALKASCPTGSVTSDWVSFAVCTLLCDVDPGALKITHVKDPLRADPCRRAVPLTFVLTAPARVKLVLDEVLTLFDDALSAGPQRIEVDPDIVPGTSKEFRLEAEALAPLEMEEVFEGPVLMEIRKMPYLPVGHTFVKGVDLADGNLVIGEADVTLPGRGLSLDLTRTYSSKSNDIFGLFGIGWTSTYESRLVKLDCTTTTKYAIQGGEGGGQAFHKLAPDGPYIAAPGYHTRFEESPGGGFDFYTKANVRYHFDSAVENLVEIDPDAMEDFRRTTLAYIQDPNGNKIEIDRLPDGRIDEVREATGGRSLKFKYQLVGELSRVQWIEVMAGTLLEYKLRYDYDARGHLRKVTRFNRDGADRTSSYDYMQPSAPEVKENRLVGWADSQGTYREYEYYPEDIVVTGPRGSFIVQSQEMVKYVWEGEDQKLQTELHYAALESLQVTTTVKDPMGRVTHYQLDENGAPKKIKEAVGTPRARETQMTWSLGDVTKELETDALDRVTRYGHDGKGNVTRETIETATATRHRPVEDVHNDAPPGHESTGARVITRYEHDQTFGKMTLKVDPEGVKTRWALDSANGNVLRMTRSADSLGALTTEYSYGAGGVLESVSDPDGRMTRYMEHDPRGNPWTIVDAEDNVTRNTYDARSRLLTSTSADLGFEIVYQYDDLDRKTMETRRDLRGGSDTSVTKWTYVGGSTLVDVQTDGLGHRADHEYDDVARLERVDHKRVGGLGPQSFFVAYGYDDNGNQKSFQNGNGVIRLTLFDELNRPVNEWVQNFTGQPMKPVSATSYDDVGNKITSTDLHGHVTTYVYDKLYRVVETVLPLEPYKTETSYDLVGNKTREKDPNGEETRSTFDRHHRLTEMVDPEGNTVQYDYDGADNVRRETRLGRTQNGASVVVTEKLYDPYDGRNRPTGWSLTVAGSDDSPYTTSITYDDPRGLRTSVDSRGVTQETVVDGLGRVRTETTKRRPDDAGVDVVVSYRYDANGNRREVKDGEGHVTTYEHDGLNRLFRTKHPKAGIEETAVYDKAGRVVSRTDRRGIERRYEYDDLDRLTLEELESSPISQVPWRHVITYDDTPVSGTWKRTDEDARGKISTSYMDALERPVKVQDPAGTVEMGYDGVNKVRETNRRRYVTTFGFDGVNRLTKTLHGRTPGVDPTDGSHGGKETVVYLDGERQRVETDRNGNVTTLSMDGLGRATKRQRRGTWTDGDGASHVEPELTLEQAWYDGETANKRLMKDGELNPTCYLYDHRQRLVRMVQGAVEPPAIASTSVVDHQWTYDADDLKVTERVGGELKHTFEYDELHHLESDRNGANETVSFVVDGDGRNLERKEPLGQVTRYTYEELGKLRSVELPDTGVYRYGYDPARNLVSQHDPDGRLTSFAYDDANRRTDVYVHKLAHPGLVAFSDADALHTGTRYDGNGNVDRIEDPKGQVTTLTYDHLDRERTRTYTGEPSAPWNRVTGETRSYDLNGNLLSVDQTYAGAPPDQETMVYDQLDRLRERTDTNLTRTLWTYLRNGSRDTVTDRTTNQQTSYAYDLANRLRTVATPAGDTTYTYTTDALKDTVTYPSGANCTYGYDGADRVSTIEDLTSTGALISRFTYQYDDNGNRTLETQDRQGASETTLYGDGSSPGSPGSGYDAAGRLVRVTYAAGTPTPRTVAYTYDKGGNRTRELATGTDPKDHWFDYNGANWLLSLHSGSSTGPLVAQYTYDDNGNQTTRTADGTTTTFSWDVRDDLRELRRGTSLLETATYDPAGRRVTKVGIDGLRRFTWDQQVTLLEAGLLPGQTGDPRPLARWHYGHDQVALVEEPTSPLPRPRFFHHDALGSVSDVTDQSGTVVARYKYDAWGVFRPDPDGEFGFLKADGTPSANAEQINRSTYTGKYYDRESNLFYFNARYYDPDTGRFISQDGFDYGDTSNPPSLHLYYYAMANPLRYVDEDGHAAGEVTILQWAKRTSEDLVNTYVDFKQNTVVGGAEVGANLLTLGGYGGVKQAYQQGALDQGGTAGLSAYRHGMSDFFTLGAVSHLEAGGTGGSWVGSASGYSNVTGGTAAVLGAQTWDQAVAGSGQILEGFGQAATIGLIASGPARLVGRGPAPRVEAGRATFAEVSRSTKPAVAQEAPGTTPLDGAIYFAAERPALPPGRMPKALIGPAGDPGLTAASTATPSFVATPGGETVSVGVLRALATARTAASQPGATPNTIGAAGQALSAEILGGRATPQVGIVSPPMRGRIFDDFLDNVGSETKNTRRPQANTAEFRGQMEKTAEAIRRGQVGRGIVFGVRGLTANAEATARRSGSDVYDLRVLPDIRDFPFQ